MPANSLHSNLLTICVGFFLDMYSHNFDRTVYHFIHRVRSKQKGEEEEEVKKTRFIFTVSNGMNTLPGIFDTFCMRCVIDLQHLS